MITMITYDLLSCTDFGNFFFCFCIIYIMSEQNLQLSMLERVWIPCFVETKEIRFIVLTFTSYTKSLIFFFLFYIPRKQLKACIRSASDFIQLVVNVDRKKRYFLFQRNRGFRLYLKAINHIFWYSQAKNCFKMKEGQFLIPKYFEGVFTIKVKK